MNIRIIRNDLHHFKKDLIQIILGLYATEYNGIYINEISFQ